MNKRSLKSKRAKEKYISFPLSILENQGRNKSDKTTKRTFNYQACAEKWTANSVSMNEVFIKKIH